MRVISLSSAVIGPESPFGWRTEIPPIGNNTRVHGTAISNIGSPHVLTMPSGGKREKASRESNSNRTHRSSYTLVVTNINIKTILNKNCTYIYKIL